MCDCTFKISLSISKEKFRVPPSVVIDAMKTIFFSHVKEFCCTVERAYQNCLACRYLNKVFENLTMGFNMTTCVYIIGNDFIDFPS